MILQIFQCAMGMSSKFSKKFKFLFRSMIYYKEVSKMLQYFNQPSNRYLTIHNSELYNKIFRPYRYCGMSVQDKVDAIISHYKTFQSLFLEEWIQKIYSDSTSWILTTSEEASIQLCIFKDISVPFSIDLCYIKGIQKEGELLLSLTSSADHLRIYSLVFSLETISDQKTLYITGMQGNRNIHTQEIIKVLTKDLHGLRPRDLLLFVSKVIAKKLDIEVIKAISTEYHVKQCSHKERDDEFQANYNQYWEEAGGIKSCPIFYLMSNQINKKDMTDIPSKKRSMYVKRYAMLDHIENEIGKKLDSGLKVSKNFL